MIYAITTVIYSIITTFPDETLNFKAIIYRQVPKLVMKPEKNIPLMAISH